MQMCLHTVCVYVRARVCTLREQPDLVLCVSVGTDPQLGSWDPLEGLEMSWQPGHAWQGHMEIPPDVEVEAKGHIVIAPDVELETKVGL
eukprot:1156204-Pelagomonas_calceolata.AAC.6